MMLKGRWHADSGGKERGHGDSALFASSEGESTPSPCPSPSIQALQM
jgi:hypothetical protein